MLMAGSLAVLGALVAASCTMQRPAEPEAPSTTVGSVGHGFLDAVASGGPLVLDAAELAATNTSTQMIRELAADIAADRREELSELAALWERRSSATAQRAQWLGDLRAKTGPDFDWTFVEVMIKQHRHELALASEAAVAAVGRSAEVASFARQVVVARQSALERLERAARSGDEEAG